MTTIVRVDGWPCAPAEEWRPVPGYEGVYEVSNRGNVRSLDRTVVGSDGRVRDFPGRRLKPHRDADGRGRVGLRYQGKEWRKPVSVLVALAFLGPKPDPSMGVRHLDGNARNDDLSNLAWGTQAENVRDRLRHGTDPNASKTHCKRGHELVAPNLTKQSIARGHRVCRACANAGTWAWRYGTWDMPGHTPDDYYERIMASARGAEEAL